jgi:hypothetical protein
VTVIQRPFKRILFLISEFSVSIFSFKRYNILPQGKNMEWLINKIEEDNTSEYGSAL